MNATSPVIASATKSMPSARGQILTAVFELRPTKRKAAILDRVRQAVERAFWERVGDATLRANADAMVGIDDKKARQAFIWNLEAEGAHFSVRHNLAKSLSDGLARDVAAAIKSYIELRRGGYAAEWPTPKPVQMHDFESALEAFVRTVDLPTENDARRVLLSGHEVPVLRPFTLSRAKEAQILRDSAGRLAVAIECIRASELKREDGSYVGVRRASIRAGMDASTGEAVSAGRSKTKLVIPLACSRWHENKFLNTKAVLRSSQVFCRGTRWFLSAQFEMPRHRVPQTGAVLGIDRGVIYPVSTAVVDAQGALLELSLPQGHEIRQTIIASERKKRSQQRRRGISTHRHTEVVGHVLHRIANDIVALAIKHGATVAIERLDGLKQVITQARPKGKRRNPWQKCLKAAQFGKLEQILDYKLSLAGLGKLKEVVAAGSSQTCAACGHKDRENRKSQEAFVCTACRHTMNADQNASIIIARRGVLAKTLKKGDRLDVLHQNMVSQLRMRDDGGLGRYRQNPDGGCSGPCC